MTQFAPSAPSIVNLIFQHANPVIHIFGVGGRRWKRNVSKGGRIGPWLQGDYKILDERAWRAKGPCLYLVASTDMGIRYVGISRNGLKHRWRTSPAYDADTMVRLPRNQIFHSQCWKHIENESTAKPNVRFEVRAIAAEVLVSVLSTVAHPIAALTALRDDGESVVSALERWICNNRTDHLVEWNVSMTRA
jgi:hypothetical protein